MTTTETPAAVLDSAVELDIRESPPPDAKWDAIRSALRPEFQFLACNWIGPWSRHILDRSRRGSIEYVCATGTDGKTLGVIPLAHQRKASFQFRSLGGLYVPHRGLAIAQDAVDPTTERLADYLTDCHNGMGVRIAPIPVADPGVGPLVDRLSERGWRMTSTHVGYRQTIFLPDTFEEYEAARKGSRWKTVGRRERKANRAHEVRLALYTTETCDDWEAVIKDLDEIQRHSWLPDRAGDMWFVGDAQAQFWAEVFGARHAGLLARIWVLYFDNKPVAFDFNIDSGPCRYSIAGHYVKNVKQYGTGSILMKYMIQDAIDRGMEKIDMGTGNSGYKTFWGAEMADAIVDWTAFPPGMRGTLMYHGSNLARNALTIRQRMQRQNPDHQGDDDGE